MTTKLISPLSQIFAALALSIFLSSCASSTRQLTYAQDLKSGEFIKGSPSDAPVYRICVKDNLYVKINSSDPELNKMFDPAETINQITANYEGQAARTINGNIVDPDGTINLPLIGRVPVEGKSLSECEELISTEARKYLKEVTVKVRLLNYKVTVLGEVKIPGIYYNYNEYYTILDALSSAQGTTDFAKLESVLIMRNEKSGTKTYSLNLNSKSLLSSEAYYLKPNDVVIVPPGKNKNAQQRLPWIAISIGSLSALLLLLNYLK